MKKNIFIMLLISSLISLSGYGQTIRFESDITTFELVKSGNSLSFGTIQISPSVLLDGVETSTIKIGKKYTIVKGQKYTVHGFFKELNLNNQKLVSLSFMLMPGLEVLTCCNNRLTSLKLTGLPGLKRLYCGENWFKSLKISNHEKLESISCYENTSLKTFEVNNLPKLEKLDIGSNSYLNSLVIGENVNKLKEIYCHDSDMSACDFDKLFMSLPTATKGLIYLALTSDIRPAVRNCRTYIANNKGWEVAVTNFSWYTTIVNTAFSCAETGSVVAQQSFTFKSDITVFKIKTTTKNKGDIRISPAVFDDEIESTIEKGKEYKIKANTVYTVKGDFEYLSVPDNKLKSLDVSNLRNLQTLYCTSNKLTSLDVSDLKNLKLLDCGNNQLPSLNVKELNKLEALYCYSNKLPRLDVKGLGNLKKILCDNNKFDACALDALFESLPKKDKANKGEIYIADKDGEKELYKKCATQIATGKNWLVYDYNGSSKDRKEIKGDGTGCPNSIPENLASELDIKVFPNPVRDALQIESEEIIKQVSIFDISGKLLIKELVNDVNFSLRTADLNTGMYVLRIQTDKDIRNVKIIKE